MPDLTHNDRRAFEDFLRIRMEARRDAWNAAKKSQDGLIALSLGVPYPDGALMREQANAGFELTMFSRALSDFVTVMLDKKWDEPGRLEQLIAEWRAERKGPGSERGVRSSEGVA